MHFLGKFAQILPCGASSDEWKASSNLFLVRAMIDRGIDISKPLSMPCQYHLPCCPQCDIIIA